MTGLAFRAVGDTNVMISTTVCLFIVIIGAYQAVICVLLVVNVMWGIGSSEATLCPKLHNEIPCKQASLQLKVFINSVALILLKDEINKTSHLFN